MAHFHGTDYVGSMVVLGDRLPNKRSTAASRVLEVDGNNDRGDGGSAHPPPEGLPRRARPAGRRKRAKPGKFAYPPQLLLVDGGKGQLSVAERVVQSLGLADEIPIASLAKRFEEVYLPGRNEPVEIPRGSEALFMLQRIVTRPTASPTPSIASCAAKRMTSSSSTGSPASARPARRSSSRPSVG
ncbi:MAG: hypothetical protein R2713_11670 [Ilumatobacteraceae bacterium]